ncbi:peptidase S8 [Alkalicoccus urumqiensis]|uniref:Peptidase S8 n=2 Tax=Alkalicoccus urumqiensis TaxID=1548213 RepID=A0A2P6MDA7_ALKUR|nr:S8 family peptidase [Alkalicoccus urumqiensis]PRO64268.1 peptidase S8 [Alkalicoccus urumqiensis]
MKKTAALSFFAVAVMIPGIAAADSGEENEYLIQFDGPSEKGLLQAFGVEGDDILHEYNELPVYLVELNDGQAEDLENHPHVVSLEENAEVQALNQEEPYGIGQIQSDEAYELGVDGAGMNVAVLDTGIDASHEDLEGNVVDGYSVFTDSENSDPYMDGNGHGTHVAGTVAAVDNDLGVIGAAPEADLFAVKVLDNDGSGSLAGIAEGLEWSVQNDIDIINMSLGGSTGSSILEEFTDLAYDEGALVVAAAGNSGSGYGFFNTVGYPARYDSAMAVAAVDENNQRASFSSTGAEVEIAAPGVGVVSTVPGNDYAALDGTSMASPHVAGAAAQVWQAKPELTNEELRALLNETAETLDSTYYTGNGLIQVQDAIDW